jgi:alanine-glyoxylate transaminase/serine-glyoxylate transaminase/serine-pyruvate transaminase
MSKNASRPVGRHFLHIPGPTPLPDRVLRAMDTPIIDHRGPEFAKLAKRCLEGIKTIFKTANPVIIYTATGTGAWEAALVNTLSPGDRVLMVETGQFATLWKTMAEKLGLRPEFITTDWRIGAEPAAVEDRLRQDKNKEIKAVCVLHNETSTGCLSRRFARRSIMPDIPHCCSWTPSPRSPRPTIATTNGGSTSPSAARRRG